MNATYGTGHPTSEVAIGERNTDVYEHFDKSLYQRETRCSDAKGGGGPPSNTFFSSLGAGNNSFPSLAVDIVHVGAERGITLRANPSWLNL